MIPEGPLHGVAVLGIQDEDDEISWMGTGFAVAATCDGTGDLESQFVALVTNRHVFEALQRQQRSDPGCQAVIGVESKGHDAARVFKIKVDGPTVAFHPDDNVDVAVTFMPLEVRGQIAGVAPVPYQNQLPLSELRDRGIGEGDDVFVLGFPMNVVAEVSHSAIVRRGCIARMRSTHAAADCRYLIDAGVYPGNSGGPVYVQDVDDDGDNSYFLAGIVCAYLPYEDVAVSAQTGSVRVVFQENSGLAMVHTVDSIREALAELVASASPKALEQFGAIRVEFTEDD